MKRKIYPIPRIGNGLDSIERAHVFTALNANCSYMQVPMDNTATGLTTFTTQKDVFRLMRMHIGLLHTPATFQRAMDVLFFRVKRKSALVYLDDVFIFSTSIYEHFTHSKAVLGLLQQARVTLRLNKCYFFQPSVHYIGHVAVPGKLQVTKDTTKGHQERRIPPLLTSSCVRS